MRVEKKSTRGAGGSKVNRVNVSLSNKTDFKLRRLATACHLNHTTLAGMFIELCLNDAQLIHDLQKEYCKYSAYKVIPIKNFNSEELEFILEQNNKREDL